MTKPQLIILGSLVGSCVGMAVETRRIVKAHNKLAATHNALVAEYDQAVARWLSHNDMVRYLLNVLVVRGIDLSEFDLIALQNFKPSDQMLRDEPDG